MNFNLLVVGIGGQGLITLTRILADAALLAGYDVKTSEVHGLSQRGGSVECHVRFGEKVFSPLIPLGKANLILSLEPLEALRAYPYASKKSKTVFLLNQKSLPLLGVKARLEEIMEALKKVAARVLAVDVVGLVKKEGGDPVFSNVFMLGVATHFLPLEREHFLQALKSTLGERRLEENLKFFALGLNYPKG